MPEPDGCDARRGDTLPGERGPGKGLRPGAVVRLRKPHACGGSGWQVTRAGADVGLECLSCRRRILLPRDEFERRLSRG